KALGVSAKDGGRQVEYEDQAPMIHRTYLNELAQNGVACRMSEFMDEQILLEKARQTAGA
ncbi:MAG TPA: hypothetical protein VFO61_04855, partial [Alphaproteobacteria bacterium]|nr:hypothetical protein [Alphaproteobacteria bacterium]